MNDWKLIAKVILGSTVLLAIVVLGLSKMAGGGTGLTVDLKRLVDGASLIKENGETRVTVVNFTDMQCPACKRAHGLTASLDTMGGVRVVLRHFPLSIHKNASIAARAVEAARQMGKPWEMVDLLFSKQEEWSTETNIEAKLIEYAKSIGMDEGDFKERLSSAETFAVVQDDVNLGDQLKLSGTPTFFVNGEQVAADFVVAKVQELLKTK